MQKTRRTNRARCPARLMAPLALSALAGCSNIIPMAGDNGTVPLDSSRAVALARRNVCDSGPRGDSLCPVLTFQATRSAHIVTFARRAQAGPADTVRVHLRDHGMRIEVEPVQGGAQP